MNIVIDYPESDERLITTEAEISELCRGVDGVDAQVLAAVARRIELSNRVNVERASRRRRLLVRLAHPHR